MIEHSDRAYWDWDFSGGVSMAGRVVILKVGGGRAIKWEVEGTIDKGYWYLDKSGYVWEGV